MTRAAVDLRASKSALPGRCRSSARRSGMPWRVGFWASAGALSTHATSASSSVFKLFLLLCRGGTPPSPEFHIGITPLKYRVTGKNSTRIQALYKQGKREVLHRPPKKISARDSVGCPGGGKEAMQHPLSTGIATARPPRRKD